MSQCLVDQNIKEMAAAVGVVVNEFFVELICETEGGIFYQFLQHPSLNDPFNFDEADRRPYRREDACRAAITR